MKKTLFYVAFGLGLTAFVTLISVYGIKKNVQMLREQTEINMDNDADTNEVEKNHAEINNAKTDYAEINNAKTNDTNSGNIEGKSDSAKNSDYNLSGQNYAVNGKKETKEESPEINDDINQDEEEYVADVISNETQSEMSAAISRLRYNGERNLERPVKGEAVIPFSMDTTVFFETLNMYKCSDMEYIGCEKGINVISATDGVVTSIENDPMYGNVITCAIGNGYEIEYGMVSDVKVEVGDEVSLGQEIGFVGEPTPYFKKEGSGLVLRITKDENAIDPEGCFGE